MHLSQESLIDDLSMSSWLEGEERELQNEGSRDQIPEEAEAFRIMWRGRLKKGVIECQEEYEMRRNFAKNPFAI